MISVVIEEKISLVTASYNKHNLIAETIQSVLKQSFQNWELIVVDDASTDGTAEVLQEFHQKDARIKVMQMPQNKGANYCRNRGIQEAEGDFIIFLDADDLLKENCLSERIKIMQNDSSLDFSVHTMQIFEKVPGDRSFNWTPNSKKALQDFLSHNLPWQTMQPIWRRAFLLRIGGFDENFQRLQDVEMHTRALLEKDLKFQLCAGSVDCYYRIDEYRKNYNSFEFMKRWVIASIQYCNKFYSILPEKSKKYLWGTVFKIYIHLVTELKRKKINREQFIDLREIILQYMDEREMSIIKRFLLLSAGSIGRLPFRVPGVNRLLSRLIIN